MEESGKTVEFHNRCACLSVVDKFMMSIQIPLGVHFSDLNIFKFGGIVYLIVINNNW